MDRLKKTERMFQILVLLLSNPMRFRTGDLAEKFQVNLRTVYRDLDTLHDSKVPVYNDKGKWAVDDSYFLPPLRFTVPQALSIFLAARLMSRYGNRYDPNMDLTFSLLASVMPAPIKEQVQKTLDWMRHLPRNEASSIVLAKLAVAWTSQRRVKITYRSLPAAEAAERVIEPYFIEPAAAGHSSYVIAYCHRAGERRIFKVERIEAIDLTDETYTIPEDFDANKYFSGAWGIVVEGEEQTVRLKFSPEIARLAEETIWHPSQTLEKQTDGSVIVTLKVLHTYELVTWILGWGQKVEVLGPAELRNEVLQTAKEMVKVYQRKGGG